MNGLSLGCRQTLASYRLSRSASSLSRFARRKKLIAMSRDGLAASDRPTSGFQPMSTLRIGQAFLAEFGAGSGALPLSSLDCLRASAPKGVQNLAPHPQEPRLWSRSPDAVTRTAKQDELLGAGQSWPSHHRQKEIARYAHVSTAATKSTKIIGESLEWKYRSETNRSACG